MSFDESLWGRGRSVDDVGEKFRRTLGMLERREKGLPGGLREQSQRFVG